MANQNVTFSAESILGEGMAGKAAKKIKKRKKRIEDIIEKETGIKPGKK